MPSLKYQHKWKTVFKITQGILLLCMLLQIITFKQQSGYEMGLRNDNGDLALHLSKNPIITDILSIEKNYDNQEIGRFVKDITNLIENIHKSDYAMKQWNMETNRYSWADLEIVLENFYKVTQKFAKKYQQEEIQKG
ncbi:Hypothetical_protein [Hexamita inflata]|uniref:Hypothetical_protein n=1 Tax=Hexamita inflata TaxID=28002 RepID=A0AA86QC41_9EUKA|nr:Hypothetical protein HINF_LOCUS41831 [Hexamita inflata]